MDALTNRSTLGAISIRPDYYAVRIVASNGRTYTIGASVFWHATRRAYDAVERDHARSATVYSRKVAGSDARRLLGHYPAKVRTTSSVNPEPAQGALTR